MLCDLIKSENVWMLGMEHDIKGTNFYPDSSAHTGHDLHGNYYDQCN